MKEAMSAYSTVNRLIISRFCCLHVAARSSKNFRAKLNESWHSDDLSNTSSGPTFWKVLCCSTSPCKTHHTNTNDFRPVAHACTHTHQCLSWFFKPQTVVPNYKDPPPVKLDTSYENICMHFQHHLTSELIVTVTASSVVTHFITSSYFGLFLRFTRF